MKKVAPLVLVVTSSMLAACGRDDAASASNASSAPPSSPAATQAAAENRGIGVVQSVDAANSSLTVAHEPIAALGWPAMTMSFKVDKPALLDGVEAGQHVEFTLRGRDMSAVVTSIEKAK